MDNKLEDLLRDISLSAIVNHADGVENIEDVLISIDVAVKSRRVVDCVQFEDFWEDLVDEEKVPYLFINFKLAPEVCEAALDEDLPVNTLNWNLVLPNVNAIEEEERPVVSFDWLDFGQVLINNDEIEGVYACLSRIIQREE
jgi:hypothetical protein